MLNFEIIPDMDKILLDTQVVHVLIFLQLLKPGTIFRKIKFSITKKEKI